MPTYEYRREDGSTFEIEQRISEDALTTCPTTGQKVTRMISGGTGLIFKGSGFYLTDYARANKGKESKSASPGEKKDSSKTASNDSSAKPSSDSPSKTSAPSKPKDD